MDSYKTPLQRVSLYLTPDRHISLMFLRVEMLDQRKCRKCQTGFQGHFTTHPLAVDQSSSCFSSSTTLVGSLLKLQPFPCCSILYLSVYWWKLSMFLAILISTFVKYLFECLEYFSMGIMVFFTTGFFKFFIYPGYKNPYNCIRNIFICFKAFLFTFCIYFDQQK